MKTTLDINEQSLAMAAAGTAFTLMPMAAASFLNLVTIPKTAN